MQINESGLTRVGLSVPAQTWFALLADFGEVLHITRNSMAALGQLGSMPAVADWRDPILPRDHSRSFLPNLGEYANLWAVRESLPSGVTYGLEVADASGHIFQRIFLSTPAHREIFEQFVTDYQSPPSEAGQWFSPNHAASIQRCQAISGRIAFLRSQQAEGSPNVRQLPIEVIPHLLAVMARAGLPIRTTHYNRALNRAVIWTPDAREDQKSTTSFFHGDKVGLQIHFPAVKPESGYGRDVALTATNSIGQWKWPMPTTRSGWHSPSATNGWNRTGATCSRIICRNSFPSPLGEFSAEPRSAFQRASRSK